MTLHERIALALGWSKRDVRSFSLLTVREMLRPKHPKLYDEVTRLVESGDHIYLVRDVRERLGSRATPNDVAVFEGVRETLKKAGVP